MKSFVYLIIIFAGPSATWLRTFTEELIPQGPQQFTQFPDGLYFS